MIYRVFLFFLFYPFLAGFALDNVTIKVQSIECSGEKSSKNTKIKVDQSISSLETRLKDLPYTNFNLASSQTINIPLNKEQELTLDSGDILHLKLLYLDQERVGLLLNWKDSEGMQLLDTRMHFGCTETMLAGAEGCEGDNGKLLAISVESKQ